jgi:hypothetical protein
MDCAAMPFNAITPATPMSEADYEFSAYDPYDVWFDGRTTDDAPPEAGEIDELDRLQEVCF